MRQWLPLLVAIVTSTLVVGCHPGIDTAGRFGGGPGSTSGQSDGQVGEYTPVTQFRLYDSRQHNADTAGQLLAGSIKSVRLNGALGVPHDAQSLVLRVNATTAEPAYITIFADGKARPENPTVAISDGAVESRDVLVPLHGKLKLSITSSVSAQLTVDLLGFVAASKAAQEADSAAGEPSPSASSASASGSADSKPTPGSGGDVPKPSTTPTESSTAPSSPSKPSPPQPSLASWQQEMLTAVNAARAEKGLALLTAEPCVSDRVANRWAAQAASGDSTNTFELGSVRLVCSASHGATGLSASGVPNASDAVTSWLNKPNLAKQLLNKHINGAGFGRAVADGRTFWSFIGVEKDRPVPPPLAGTRRGVHFNVTETSAGSGIVTRWPCTDQITVRLVGPTPAGAPEALAKAVAHVRQASNLPLVVGAATAKPSDDEQVIEVRYGPLGTEFRGEPIPARAAGVGGPKWLTSGRIFRGDVLIRSDHSASNPATASGLQVLAHEIAHTLGVGHAMDGQTEVMAPQTTPALAKRLKALAADPAGNFWGRGDQSALRMVGCTR